MAPVPTKIQGYLVPGTEWIAYELRDGQQVEVARGGVTVEPNIDTTCFSIRSVEAGVAPGDEDLIHFCDWPALRDTIERLMADRAAEDAAANPDLPEL